MTINDTRKVLGIDLASKRWSDVGTAVLSFSYGENAQWRDIRYGAIRWPLDDLTPEVLAENIINYVRQNGIIAVSLDGPQGWRELNAGTRFGVGRWCEYQAQCQGKTGEFGHSYPFNSIGWFRFCIDVFECLLAEGAEIANDVDVAILDPPAANKFWLLECYPTRTWRDSELQPLPGNRRVRRSIQQIGEFARTLAQRYALPIGDGWHGSHDNLQAIVAALPAAALLNGPCEPICYGKSSWCIAPHGYRVEGIIWSCRPHGNRMADDCRLPPVTAEPVEIAPAGNPVLIENNIDAAGDLIERGVRVLYYLIHEKTKGNSIGVGYAQLARCVHNVAAFADITGRRYLPSDSGHVVDLARQITDEAGGRQRIIMGDISLDVGMDAFVWREAGNHDRDEAAFANEPFTKDQWLSFFPDGQRQLLDDATLSRIADGTPDDLHRDEG